MSTVLKFPGAVAPISKPISRGSSVSTNRRSGYVICWRSLMAADWAKSAVSLPDGCASSVSQPMRSAL